MSFIRPPGRRLMVKSYHGMGIRHNWEIADRAYFRRLGAVPAGDGCSSNKFQARLSRYYGANATSGPATICSATRKRQVGAKITAPPQMAIRPPGLPGYADGGRDLRQVGTGLGKLLLIESRIAA